MGLSLLNPDLAASECITVKVSGAMVWAGPPVEWGEGLVQSKRKRGPAQSLGYTASRQLY